MNGNVKEYLPQSQSGPADLAPAYRDRAHSGTAKGMAVMVWRIINSLMATFFFLAAMVNVNDGDWYIWVPLYGFPCGLCALAVLRPSITGHILFRLIAGTEFSLCLLYGIYQIYSLTTVISGVLENHLQHEEGRELGGLIIILAWTGLFMFSGFGSSQPMSNSTMFAVFLWTTGTLAVLPLLTWSLCFVGDWHRKLAHCNNMF
ncbi:transmembrane protein 220 [Aplysia californica]|uniref:Transmembrane protein 220 n=1 Tax=Aplysia californica TaxID=6500 RepID=A0ABM1VVM9_APLCA|nr:transmembrane protein 220 [Aplysia californica]XP_035826471.1 transmembrane protein 220 [Aplysia californica]